MEFLLTQLYGPAFNPEYDFCSYLWGRNVTGVGTGFPSSLCPQHNPRPEVHTHCLCKAHPSEGSAGHLSPHPLHSLGPSSFQAVPQPQACVCLDSPVPDLWGLKCQLCLIREGGGAEAG